MNKEQFESLKNVSETVIRGNMVNSKETFKCLIHGYTCERDTFDVYLDNKELVIEVTDYYGKVLSRLVGDEITDNSQYVPNKRVYPEKSDYEFCLMLKKAGVYIPFTVFTDR